MRTKINLLLAGLLVTGSWACKQFDGGTATVTPTPLEVKGDQVQFTANIQLPANKKYKEGMTYVVKPELGDFEFESQSISLDNFPDAKTSGINHSFTFSAPYVESAMKSDKLDIETDFIMSNGKNKDGKDLDDLAECCTKTSGLFMVNTQLLNTPVSGEKEAMKLVSQFNFPQDVFKLDPSQITDEDVATIKNFLEDETSSGKIQIHGYASPEGPYERNAMLSRNRAQVVKDILSAKLKAAGYEGSLDERAEITVNTTIEDWNGFTALVDNSAVNNKEEILIVAQSNAGPAEKERQLINAAGGVDKIEPQLAPLRRTRVVIPCKVVCVSPEELDSMAVAYIEGRATAEELKEIYTEEQWLAAAQATDAPAGKKSLLVAYYDMYPNDYRAYNELGVLTLSGLTELKIEDDEFKAEGDGWELKVEDDEMKYEDENGEVKAEDDEFTIQKDGSKLKVEDDEIKMEEGSAKAKIEDDGYKVKDTDYKLKVDADGEVQLEDGEETVKLELDGRKYEDEASGLKIKNEDDFKIKDDATGLKLKIRDGEMTVKENGETYRFEEIANNPHAQQYINRYDEALQQFERANSLRNNDNIILSNLGAVYITKQQLADGKTYLQKSLSLKETPEAHYNLGLAHALEGDYETALAEFNKAGDAPQYLYNRGLTKLMIGDFDGAKSDLASFIIEYPNEAVAYYVLAVTGARSGEPSLVTSNLQKACELDHTLVERAKSDLEFKDYDVTGFDVSDNK